MLSIQKFKKVENLEEAWELNQKRNNRIIGGMMWMRLGDTKIQTAIDLSGLGLNTIEETEEEFRIGCMTSLRQLETHEGLHAYTEGTLKEALRHIVGVQFRNLATVGGSLYGRYGFSDVLTLFLALDSYVELYKGGVMSLKDYAKKEKDNDILVRLIVKKRPVHMYYEAVRITETDLPVLTCCGTYDEEKGYQISIGARPGRAVLVEDEEGILNREITKDVIDAFSAYAKEHVITRSNMRGSKEYRSRLVSVVCQRALVALTEKRG